MAHGEQAGRTLSNSFVTSKELAVMARYKVVVTFQGIASLEIEADTPNEARQHVKDLTIADLSRANRTDILSLHVGAREIIPVSEADMAEDESAPQKSRPSGWYRPA